MTSPRPFLLLTGLALCAGCDSGKTQVDFRHSQERKGTPVASFDHDAITAEELAQRFGEMSPFARTRYQTVEQKKEYVEGLLRFELLAQEAVARGMQNDPDVVETAKKVMVQKLVQKELEARATPPSDADLAAYYQKHQADYVKPLQVRLSQVFLAAPASDAALRAQKKQRAQEVLARAQALDALDFAAFGRLARELSEDPRTKPLDGDLRFLTLAELEASYGAEVSQAAAALAQVGQLSSVVESPAGFHLLKLQGKQAALDLKLADVKAQIQSRLLYERRMAGHERFIEELKKKHNARVDDAALARVKVDLQAPPQEPSGATPGFLPPSGSAPPPTTNLAPPGGVRASQQ